MVVLTIVGVFIFFWRDLQRREKQAKAEAARKQQRQEEQAKRDAEYARVRRQVRSGPKAITRSLPRTQQPPVATPRQAAPAPTVRRPTITPPPAPAATQDTSVTDVLVGAAIGYAIGSIVNNDDRPSQSCSSTDSSSFSSGGDGDFGGGGASGSWDDNN